MSPRLLPAVFVLLVLGLAGPATAAPPEGDPASEARPVVDLNHAGVDELCTLPGIGRKKAEAIIALRDRRPFTRVTQLLQIKGIGHKTLLKLKPRVTVTLPGSPSAASASTPAQPEPAHLVVTARR